MTEPLPPRSAIVDACRLLYLVYPERAAGCAIKNPTDWPAPINVARRLAELAPHLYPADPDPITLAVREVMALNCTNPMVAQNFREGEYDSFSPFLAIRAVIEKLIEELKP